MSRQLDVQGFSHENGDFLAKFHAAWPDKPISATECCSCETQRGEDNDIPYNESLVYYSSFNAPCVAEQTQAALGQAFVSGFVECEPEVAAARARCLLGAPRAQNRTLTTPSKTPKVLLRGLRSIISESRIAGYVLRTRAWPRVPTRALTLYTPRTTL